MNSITLRHLEIFVAVARAGHVTRAAAQLHLTQSATSMALAQLQRQLDVLLFERDGRTLKLSERGRMLLAEAPELLSKVRSLPALLQAQGTALRGVLQVAASTTTGRYLLAPALAALAAAHPAVEVKLSIGNTEAAIQALLAHRADVAYVEGPVARRGLRASAWRDDHMEIVVARDRGQRQASRRIARAELARLQWVMREPGSGTREVLETALRSAGLPAPTSWLSFDDSEAVLQAVAGGVGAACLSRLVIEESLRSKRLMILRAPALELQRTLWRVTREGTPSSPLQDALQQRLRPSAPTGRRTRAKS